MNKEKKSRKGLIGFVWMIVNGAVTYFSLPSLTYLLYTPNAQMVFAYELPIIGVAFLWLAWFFYILS